MRGLSIFTRKCTKNGIPTEKILVIFSVEDAMEFNIEPDILNKVFAISVSATVRYGTVQINEQSMTIFRIQKIL